MNIMKILINMFIPTKRINPTLEQCPYPWKCLIISVEWMGRVPTLTYLSCCFGTVRNPW